MADIVKFPEANRNFVAEGCNDLPAFQGEYSDGTPVIISCWKLTPEEVAEVVRTGRIYLHICSTAQPPVLIQAHSPFAVRVTDN